MLTLAYQLTRRQNRPRDPPGAGGNLDSPPDTAAVAGVNDRAPVDPIITDSDAEHMAESWWSGVVVSALASINEVNQHRARSVLRWMTVSGFNSR